MCRAAAAPAGASPSALRSLLSAWTLWRRCQNWHRTAPRRRQQPCRPADAHARRTAFGCRQRICLRADPRFGRVCSAAGTAYMIKAWDRVPKPGTEFLLPLPTHWPTQTQIEPTYARVPPAFHAPSAQHAPRLPAFHAPPALALPACCSAAATIPQPLFLAGLAVCLSKHSP